MFKHTNPKLQRGTVTEALKDLYLALRDAFVQGVRATAQNYSYDEAQRMAKARWPITETKPREVMIGGATYRVQSGVLEFKLLGYGGRDDKWITSSDFADDKLALYKQVLELLANPTEEVAL